MGAPLVVKPSARPPMLALNGQRVELLKVDPATTLLNYIRTEAGLRGTKRGCGEGGCGACVVLLLRYNPQTKEVKEFTINSCLVLLCSVDGCAITTTEGLGNQRDGFHTIHKRLSAFHASQCGFCTPGMTMAIYGCLKNGQTKNSQPGANSNGNYDGDHGTLDSELNIEKLVRAVGGNLCRCTGYRPILDACKTFACDVDLEDLGLNTCWTDAVNAKPEQLPKYDPREDPPFPKFLIDNLEALETAKGQGVDKCEGLAARFRHVEASVGEEEKERVWVTPRSLAEDVEREGRSCEAGGGQDELRHLQSYQARSVCGHQPGEHQRLQCLSGDRNDSYFAYPIFGVHLIKFAKRWSVEVFEVSDL